MTDKSIKASTKLSRPEFTYALLGMTIFLWIATFLIYFDTRDLDSPILILDTLMLKGSYIVVDSDSYLRFLGLPIIFSIVTILFFKFSREVKT